MELRLFAFADANRYARLVHFPMLWSLYFFLLLLSASLWLLTQNTCFSTRVKYLTYALSNACRAAALFTILTWDYFLMLGAMTFNAGIFLSIVSGVACGFLFMGHLFITNSVAATSERVLASLHYPQRVDVACSPQVESSPSAPPRGLLSAVEISQCGCTVWPLSLINYIANYITNYIRFFNTGGLP